MPAIEPREVKTAKGPYLEVESRWILTHHLHLGPDDGLTCSVFHNAADGCAPFQTEGVIVRQQVSVRLILRPPMGVPADMTFAIGPQAEHIDRFCRQLQDRLAGSVAGIFAIVDPNRIDERDIRKDFRASERPI